MDELYNKKSLDKIISISKDVEHLLYRFFLINLSLTILMGTVILLHIGSLLPSAI